MFLEGYYAPSQKVVGSLGLTKSPRFYGFSSGFLVTSGLELKVLLKIFEKGFSKGVFVFFLGFPGFAELRRIFAVFGLTNSSFRICWF